MAQSFRKIKSKAELDKLIDTVTRNKKTLQGEVTDQVVGKEFAQTASKTDPIITGLNEIVKKIDDRLSVPSLKNGQQQYDDKNKVIRIGLLEKFIAENQDLTAQIRAETQVNSDAIAKQFKKITKADKNILEETQKISRNLNLPLSQVATAIVNSSKILNGTLKETIQSLAGAEKKDQKEIIVSVGVADKKFDEIQKQIDDTTDDDEFFQMMVLLVHQGIIKRV